MAASVPWRSYRLPICEGVGDTSCPNEYPTQRFEAVEWEGGSDSS